LKIQRDVAYWHSSDVLRRRCDVGCWSNCGPDLLAASLSHFDPYRTLSRLDQDSFGSDIRRL
jgi:hypothetical protein